MSVEVLISEPEIYAPLLDCLNRVGFEPSIIEACRYIVKVMSRFRSDRTPRANLILRNCLLLLNLYLRGLLSFNSDDVNFDMIFAYYLWILFFIIYCHNQSLQKNRCGRGRTFAAQIRSLAPYPLGDASLKCPHGESNSDQSVRSRASDPLDDTGLFFSEIWHQDRDGIALLGIAPNRTEIIQLRRLPPSPLDHDAITEVFTAQSHSSPLYKDTIAPLKSLPPDSNRPRTRGCRGFKAINKRLESKRIVPYLQLIAQPLC